MILHVCSHFGDIELLEGRGGATRIRYERLTPKERQVLMDFLKPYGMRLEQDNGETLVPVSLWEAGEKIGQALNQGESLVTAVKFSTGAVEVEKGGTFAWLKRKFGFSGSDMPVKLPKNVLPFPKTEAAVQVPMPQRGCPMPTVTELKEKKAAAVVRKFLAGQQIEDFDRERAFIAVGKDTGHLYRITTRWSPLVEHFGVLHDLDKGTRVCASNLKVPPSEEALSMFFAVEHFEQEFLNSSQ